MAPLLTTDRLVFWPFQPGDLALLAELHGAPEVMQHLTADGEPWPAEVLAGKLERFVNEQARWGFSKWKVHRRDDGRFIGRAGFAPFGDAVELGFILEREAWGHGYATECARGLLAWIFREHPEVDRVVAFARPDNVASRHVLEKIGMTFTGPRTVNGLETAFYETTRETAPVPLR